jgi:TonB family protein
MHRSIKIRRVVSSLVITLASAFANAAVSRAQDHGQESAPSAKRQETHTPPTGVQILTPTNGVDFRPYLNVLVRDVRKKWYASMPEAALKGEKGEAVIRFRIESNGNAEGVILETSSGKDMFDKAAIQAIGDSAPFEPLPQAFKGPFISLRFVFNYNVRPAPEETLAALADCGDTQNATPPEAPFDQLELLAFTSHTLDNTYAKQTVCRRGINFNPDADALNILQINGLSATIVRTVSELKPKTINHPSAEDESAFVSLKLALEDQRGSQPKAADVDFKRALEYADNSAALHAAYSGYLLLQKRFSEAEVQSRRSLEIWPDNADAHVMLAVALTSEGKSAQAVPEAREALRIDPDHKSALVILGFSLSGSGQYAEAIPVLRKALFWPLNLPIIHKHLGTCLVHTRDFDGAIKELTTFLETNPNDADAHYLLGVAFREKGQKSDAEIQFHEANRIEPANPLYSTVADRNDPAEAPTDGSNSTGPRPEDGVVSGNNYTNTFFGFSYEFPKGWAVLEAERSKAIIRIGGSIVANGDPVLADVAEVAARNMHSLLFVAKESTKGISSNFNLINIAALDKRFAPDNMSGEEIAKAVAAAWQHRSQALSAVGAPERFDSAGRSFWKVKFDFSMENQVVHCIEAVTIEKGYALMFIFSSVDATKLDDLVGTLVSVRFTAAQ